MNALEMIPRYNGTNIPLNVFLSGFKDACEILPQGYELELAKMIKIRLYGEALNCASDGSFTTMDQIAKFFDTRFGSSKNYLQLNGELASLKQRRDESVIVFSNRVLSLRREIIAAAKREGRFTEEFMRFLENDLMKCFLRGLHWIIKARMTVTENLHTATQEAIEIEREFACYDQDELSDLKKISQSKNEENKAKIFFMNEKPRETCQICDKIGHTALKCFSLSKAARERTMNNDRREKYNN